MEERGTKGLESYLMQRIASYRKVVIRECQRAGEEAVNIARSSKGYNDRSGNLRSSIGYTVVEEGRVVGSKVEDAKGGVGKGGVSKGQEFAARLAARFPQNVALILTAGMEYAGYVEARGLDVLLSAELHIERELPKRLQQLASKAK